MAKYIDANALMDELNNQFRDMDNNVYDSQDDALEDAEVSVSQVIYNLPAADVEPVRHGKWRFCGDDGFENAYVCSECGKIANDDSKFCPRCGAKMDGGDKND